MTVEMIIVYLMLFAVTAIVITSIANAISERRKEKAAKKIDDVLAEHPNLVSLKPYRDVPQYNWPPRPSASAYPEGTRKYGSTGQLFEATNRRWEAVNPTKRNDDSFDTTGFIFGLATGVPISPAEGVSLGSIIGSELHSEHKSPESSSGSWTQSFANGDTSPSTSDSSSSTSSSSSGYSDSGSSSSSSDSFSSSSSSDGGFSSSSSDSGSSSW